MRSRRAYLLALVAATTAGTAGVSSAAAPEPAKPACASPAAKSPGSDGVIRGSNRSEAFNGDAADNKIYAGAGNDRVCARRGNDIARGGPGADRIRAQGGADKLVGGSKKDLLQAGGGGDRIFAADTAADTILAGRGRDRIRSDDGFKDKIGCGPGYDTVHTDGDDILKGCETVRLGRLPDFALPSWNDTDWGDPSNYETIQTADIDGDGTDELIGRSNAGVQVYRFAEDLGQWLPLPRIESFKGGGGIDGGWGAPQYYSTIQAANLDGEKGDEIFGRGAYGIYAVKWDQDSQTWSPLPETAGLPHSWSDAIGWADCYCYYSTIQAADLDGDGAEEIFGRGGAGIEGWKYHPENPDATKWEWLDIAGGPGAWSDQANWNQPQYYETIGAANLDGDNQGTEEIYGRWSDGLAFWGWNEGQGWFSALSESFANPADRPADPAGWAGSPSYYQTFHDADFDGDGQSEIFARGGLGVQVFKFNVGTRLWDFRQWGSNEPYPQSDNPGGWKYVGYYSTLQAADLDGDGRDELLGRASWGILTWKFSGQLPGGQWTLLAPAEGDFCDSCGWAEPSYYETIQTARIGPFSTLGAKPKAALIGRGGAGILTHGLVETAPGSWNWTGLSAELPAFTGNQLEIYNDINARLGKDPDVDNPDFDLRSMYGGAEKDLENYATKLAGYSPLPSENVSDWNAVVTQLTAELHDQSVVASHFGEAGELRARLSGTYLTELFDDSTVKLRQKLTANFEYEQKVDEIVQAVIEAVGALAAIAPPVGEIIEVYASLGSAAFTMGVALTDQGSANDVVQNKYDDYKAALGAKFSQVTTQLGAADTQIRGTGDYGLMSAVGQMIDTGLLALPTGDAQNAYNAQLQKASLTELYKSITESAFVIYRYDAYTNYPALNMLNNCNSPHYCYVPPCSLNDCSQGGQPRYSYQLSWTHDANGSCAGHGAAFNPCNRVDESDPLMFQKLFAEPTGIPYTGAPPAPRPSGCFTDFTVDCGLGVSQTDFFLRQNGWEDVPWRKCVTVGPEETGGVGFECYLQE